MQVSEGGNYKDGGVVVCLSVCVQVSEGGNYKDRC